MWPTRATGRKERRELTLRGEAAKHQLAFIPDPTEIADAYLSPADGAQSANRQPAKSQPERR